MNGEVTAAVTISWRACSHAIYGFQLLMVLIAAFLVVRRKREKTAELQYMGITLKEEQELLQVAQRRKEERNELAQHLDHLRKVQNEVRSQIVHLRAASLKIKK